MFTIITNDRKQLNKKAREEREKNSQTNFDTLNTPKEKLDDAKNFLRQKRRERRRGLSHLLLLSHHIRRPRWTLIQTTTTRSSPREVRLHIFLFFHDARAYILLFLSSHPTTKGKAAIFESENNGQHFWAKRNSNALLSSNEL